MLGDEWEEEADTDTTAEGQSFDAIGIKEDGIDDDEGDGDDEEDGDDEGDGDDDEEDEAVDRGKDCGKAPWGKVVPCGGSAE